MTEENLKPEEIVAEVAVVEEITAPVDEPVVEPVAKVEVEEVVETPKPAPVKPAPSKPEQKYATPVAVTLDDIEKSKPVPAGPAVVSNKEVDDVHLDKIIYKNLYARKSLSVHHLQRRLFELGYAEAHKDKDGYYGDYTKSAILRFQLENKLEANGMVDAKTLTLLFTGDPNVNVIL
jgi:uncharacterized protein (DUF1499 family)